MRKTKIICTLGPATESADVLQAMITAGANIFRLNMSHAPHDWVRMIVPRIRAIAKELGVMEGILMDTQGPAIRTGDLPTKLDLKIGDIFEFTVRGTERRNLLRGRELRRAHRRHFRGRHRPRGQWQYPHEGPGQAWKS